MKQILRSTFLTAIPLLVVALALFLSSCSNDSQPVIPQVKAGVGSTFNYHVVSYDEAGAVIADSAMTYTVISNSAALGGRSGISAAANADGDTLYFVYSDRGITYYQPAIPIIDDIVIPYQWITLDSAEHTPGKTIIRMQDTTVQQGVPIYFTLGETQTRLTDTVLTVNGVSQGTKRWTLRTIVTATVSLTGQTSTTTVDVTRAFAPKLGYIASEITTTNSDSPFSPVPNGIEVRTLTEAMLK